MTRKVVRHEETNLFSCPNFPTILWLFWFSKLFETDLFDKNFLTICQTFLMAMSYCLTESPPIPPVRPKQIPLYLILKESNFFRRLRRRKTPLNPIIPSFMAFLCIIGPNVDFFNTKLSVRTLKCWFWTSGQKFEIFWTSGHKNGSVRNVI